MGAMKRILNRLLRSHPRESRSNPLLRSFLAFYNGQMETVAGRNFFQTNERGDPV
jgi:hypothetical protein